MRALAQLVDRACAAHADRVALAAGDTILKYRELDAAAGALAAHLPLEPDEPALVMVSNRPRDLVAFLAVWRAGGVVVPVHRSTPNTVLERLVARTGARIIVDDDRRIDGTPPPRRALLADAALVIFTSGSTGEPKGAVLTHDAIAGKLAANDTFLHFAAGERTLLVLNITFSFGIWVSLLTLAKGGTLVMDERFRAERFIDRLRGVHRVAVVPTMMRALEPHMHAPYDGALAQILIGGEFLPAAVGSRIVARFPRAELIDIYGLTETATSDFILMHAERAQHGGTIGRPAPGIDYRIVDGELRIRTPYRMAGYLDQPELTVASFADGYFRTGDLARERDGVVELVGRAKEIIVRGGTKVSPLEIEKALARHADVAAVLVAGVEDAVLGERIHAFIVARPGAAIDARTLAAFATEQLEREKRPDAYHFGAELPLGRTGKADRGALRESLSASTTRAGSR